ncbi:MAG: GAF domain-containing SpoIIE family protein phosphatase [Bacteroidota bacterium]
MTVEPSIQLQEENNRLRKAVQELSVLNDLARDISSTMSLDEVIQNIVKRSVRALHCQQGTITLVNEEVRDEMKTFIRTNDSTANHEQFHLNQNILGWMMLNKKPMVSNDISTDARFQGIKVDSGMKSILCVPLLIKNALIGILTVFNKKDNTEFGEDDKRLLAIIAAQSAQVLENARLYDQEKSLLAMQEQMKLAQKIQYDLLPKKSPEIPGFDIVGATFPAQSIGGDYFDFIPLESQRWAICLGDVTGKGLPASLLMANVQATLRGQAIVSTPPSECLSRSNRLLYDSTSPEKFVTLFYIVIDPNNDHVVFCNAGHDHPYLLTSTDQIIRLKTGGLMLGIMPSYPFKEETISFKPGDTLVMYSDGVPEARNNVGDFFGDEALEKILIEHRSQSPAHILSSVIEAVKKHAGTHPQSDDITIVVIRRTP